MDRDKTRQQQVNRMKQNNHDNIPNELIRIRWLVNGD